MNNTIGSTLRFLKTCSHVFINYIINIILYYTYKLYYYNDMNDMRLSVTFSYYCLYIMPQRPKLPKTINMQTNVALGLVSLFSVSYFLK